MIKNVITVTIIAVLFAGCSKTPVSDMAAEYWYMESTKEVARYNLDIASDYYSSLIAEHPRSPLIKEATLMMATAHQNNDEYLLANFYLDEYIKRFGNLREIDRVRFLKLVADYKGVIRSGRDQKLLIDSAKHIEEFMDRYNSSDLAPYAQTLLTHTELASSEMNHKIAGLYTRLKKPLASDYYAQKAHHPATEAGIITPTIVRWPRSWFE